MAFVGVLVFLGFIYSLIAIIKPSVFLKFFPNISRKKTLLISAGMFVLLIILVSVDSKDSTEPIASAPTKVDADTAANVDKKAKAEADAKAEAKVNAEADTKAAAKAKATADAKAAAGLSTVNQTTFLRASWRY